MVIAGASMLDRVLYGLLVVLVGWPCDLLRRVGLQWVVEAAAIDSHKPQHAKYLLAYLLPSLLVRLVLHRTLPVRWTPRARVALLCVWVWCWLFWNACYAMDGAIAYRYEPQLWLLIGLAAELAMTRHLARRMPLSTRGFAVVIGDPDTSRGRRPRD